MTKHVWPMPSKARILSALGALLFLALFAQLAPAAEPVGWRTDGSGKYSVANPPTHWSPQQNVIWATPMPSPSNSTPIIVGDRLFVCSEPTMLLALRLSDGQIVWQRTNDYADVVGPEQAAAIRENPDEAESLRQQLQAVEVELQELRQQLQDDPDNAELKDRFAALQQQRKDLQERLASYEQGWWSLPARHDVTGYSTPTPVSDGQHVYVVFGTGVVACYDLDGNRRWIRLLEKPKNDYGHSTSPLLIDGKLLIHIVNLTALNPETGETLWQTPLAESCGTPVHVRVGEMDAVITPAGDIVSVADGQVLAPSQAKLTYCAPVVEGDVVYFIERGGKALRLPSSDGTTIAPQVLWETNPRDDRYYASPVIQDGLVYAVMQTGVFSLIDASTGQVLYERQLNLGGGTVFPSISLAGDYIFLSKDNGTTLVLRAGREYQEVAANTLEPFRSCLVFAGDRMYVRGLQHLYCIGVAEAK